MQPTANDALALAAACCKGERRAQRRLWEQYRNRMYGVCLRFAGRPEEAEDMLQEGFVRVYQHICQYRGEGSLEGWIRRVIIRTCLQMLQQQQHISKQVDIDTLDNLLHTAESVDPEHPEPGRLVALLQQLPPGFRAVLNLYVIEERSHEEIARELGISVGASKSQLSRAKAFFRKLLDKTLLLI